MSKAQWIEHRIKQRDDAIRNSGIGRYYMDIMRLERVDAKTYKLVKR